MTLASDPKPPSRGDEVAAWLVFALAIALRIPALLRPLYLDEFATLEVINAPSFADAMQLLRDDTHHPLYFGLLYYWAELSRSTPWLRLMTLLFDAVALGVLHMGLRRISFRAATIGMALWGVCPVALRFSTELRPYAPLSCLAVLALVLAHRCATEPAWRPRSLVLTALAWLGLVATHPVGALAVAAIGVAVLVDVLGDTDMRAAVPGRLLRLAPAALCAGAGFAALHWWFAYDPSGSRISWMPALSTELVARILNYSYGTDAGAPWGLLGVTWNSTHAAGICIFAGLLLAGAGVARGRLWALASLLDFCGVAAVSVLQRPIFWYRSIVPALIFAAGAGGIGLAHRRRAGLIVVALAVLWQTAIWVPRATRAVDPTAVAATSAVAQMGPHDALYVFPDWMYITARPFLDRSRWSHILPCGGDPNRPDAPLADGVAVVRSNLDLIPGAAGLAACLTRMRQRGVVLHDLYLFLDDDDDMYRDSQDKRHALLDTVQSAFGPCFIDDPDSRVVHMACPGRPQPPVKD